MFYHFAQKAGKLIQRHLARLFVAPAFVFGHAFGEAVSQANF
jgi:hypothetical protein